MISAWRSTFPLSANQLASHEAGRSGDHFSRTLHIPYADKLHPMLSCFALHAPVHVIGLTWEATGW
jgi:hypothetical protein